MTENALTIQPMSSAAVYDVRRLETASLAQPQVPIPTQHTLHAGMYARTVLIPAGVLITGALIKIPTILIVSGHAMMYGCDGPVELCGYAVFSAFAGRKQAFVAVTDTYLTMVFPTKATTVEEAENEFTDEVDLLASRRDEDRTVECQG
jgi:hypothetical protein